jgi:hypothetical protein
VPAWARVTLLVLAAGAVQLACSLNPQPIPPFSGDDDDDRSGGSIGEGSSSNGGLPVSPGDAGTSDAADAATDAGEQDAGDAGEQDAGEQDDDAGEVH